MRVCFLHTRYHPIYSGHAIQLDQIRSRLREKGILVEVWTPRLDASPTEEIRDGVIVRRFGPAGSSRSRRYARACHLMGAAVLRRNTYDILHLAGVNDETRWLVPAVKLAGRKVVWQMTLMGSDDPLTLLARRPPWLFKRLFRQVDGWIALGTALAETHRRSPLPKARLSIIPVGAELERFKPAADRAAIRRLLGLPVDAPIVVTVGSVIRRKGYDRLVEAVALVVKAIPDALFVWIGPTSTDPAFVQELEARIQALELQEHIRLIGASPEVPSFLQAGDVFAFPTRAEGLPNAVIEASGTGLPVVMSDLPGIASDLVEDGKTGHIVPQDDVAAFADRLIGLLKDPHRRERFGRLGRQRMLERFEISRVVDQYVALYRKLLGS